MTLDFETNFYEIFSKELAERMLYILELFQNEICIITVITCKIVLTEIGLLLIVSQPFPVIISLKCILHIIHNFRLSESLMIHKGRKNYKT